jgi:O-antigen/teichoic acid export membrane protein
MAYVIGGMTLFAAGLWIIAPLLVPLVGSHRFDESVGVFRWLLIGVPCACFNTLMAIQWIMRGYFYRVSLITFGTGIFNCAANLVLIPTKGADGAAIAAVIGMCALPFLANLWLALETQRELAQSRG